MSDFDDPPASLSPPIHLDIHVHPLTLESLVLKRGLVNEKKEMQSIAKPVI